MTYLLICYNILSAEATNTGRSHLTEWENTLHFSLTASDGRYTITATCEPEDNPLAHMVEVMWLFGTTNPTMLLKGDGGCTGYSITVTQKTILDVMGPLLGNHFEKPSLLDSRQEQIAAAARPSACRLCSSSNIKLLGNIFRCSSCGALSYPLCCTRCGGELLIGGMGKKTCGECSSTFAPPGTDAAEKQP